MSKRVANKKGAPSKNRSRSRRSRNLRLRRERAKARRYRDEQLLRLAREQQQKVAEPEPVAPTLRWWQRLLRWMKGRMDR